MVECPARARVGQMERLDHRLIGVPVRHRPGAVHGLERVQCLTGQPGVWRDRSVQALRHLGRRSDGLPTGPVSLRLRAGSRCLALTEVQDGMGCWAHRISAPLAWAGVLWRRAGEPHFHPSRAGPSPHPAPPVRSRRGRRCGIAACPAIRSPPVQRAACQPPRNWAFEVPKCLCQMPPLHPDRQAGLTELGPPEPVGPTGRVRAGWHRLGQGLGPGWWTFRPTPALSPPYRRFQPPYPLARPLWVGRKVGVTKGGLDPVPSLRPPSWPGKQVVSPPCQRGRRA